MGRHLGKVRQILARVGERDDRTMSCHPGGSQLLPGVDRGCCHMLALADHDPVPLEGTSRRVDPSVRVSPWSGQDLRGYGGVALCNLSLSWLALRWALTSLVHRFCNPRLELPPLLSQTPHFYRR